MPFDLSKVNALVVEDLKPMRNLLVHVLEAFGIGTVHEASNGEQAYKIFQETKPDIIITDWLMEPVNGLELISRIRDPESSVDPYVPIIVVTGYSALQRVMMARDLGATEFLAKPFTGADLAKRINQVINKPRDFVYTDRFFGPDRRRRKADNFKGGLKRDGEAPDPPNGEQPEPLTSDDAWDIVIR